MPIMILRNDWRGIVICWWFCSLPIKARSKTTRRSCFWKTNLPNILSLWTSNHWNSTIALFCLKSSFHLTVEIHNIFVLTKFVLIYSTLRSRVVIGRVLVWNILIDMIHNMLTSVWTIIAKKRPILKRCHWRCLWICSIQQLSFVLILSWRRWQMLVCLVLNWFVVTLLKTRINTHPNASLLRKMIVKLIFLSLKNLYWSSRLLRTIELLCRRTPTDHIRKIVLNNIILSVYFLFQIIICLLVCLLWLSDWYLTLWNLDLPSRHI